MSEVECGRATAFGPLPICEPCAPYGKCLMPPPVIVRPAPDPERDARVAARRATDAARAGRALDALLGVDRRHAGLRMPCEVCPGPCTIDD